MGVLRAKVNGVWEDVVGADETVPPGGTANQVLAKKSATDFDADWADIVVAGGLPLGGTTNQVLGKLSNTDQDAGWINNVHDATDVSGVGTANDYLLPGAYVIQGNQLPLPGYARTTTGNQFGVMTVVGSASSGFLVQTWVSSYPDLDVWVRSSMSSGGTWGPWEHLQATLNQVNDYDTLVNAGVYAKAQYNYPGGPPADPSDPNGVLVVSTPTPDGSSNDAPVQTWTGATSIFSRIRLGGVWQPWIQIAPAAAAGGLPAGGTTDQVLAKISDTDQDAGWVDLAPKVVDLLAAAVGIADTTVDPGFYLVNGTQLGLPDISSDILSVGVMTVTGDPASITNQSWHPTSYNSSSTERETGLWQRTRAGASGSWTQWAPVVTRLMGRDPDLCTVVGTYSLESTTPGNPLGAATAILITSGDVLEGKTQIQIVYPIADSTLLPVTRARKNATTWSAWRPLAVPPGGTTGQVLAKSSASDGEVEWVDAAAGGGIPDGGAQNQVLAKESALDQDAVWRDSAFPPVTVLPPGTAASSLGQAGIYRITGTDAGLPSYAANIARVGLLVFFQDDPVLGSGSQTWYSSNGVDPVPDVWSRTSALGTWTPWFPLSGLLTTTDYNTVRTTGRYLVAGNATNGPDPLDASMGLLVIDSRSAYLTEGAVQTWTSLAATGPVQWMRTYTVGTTWTAWIQTAPAAGGGSGLPPGGTTDQVLAKISDADQDAGWVDATSGPAGPAGPAGADGADGADGAPGAVGPAGPSAVSTDAGNAATLGTDSLIFVAASASGLDISADAGNLLKLGTDGGLYLGIADLPALGFGTYVPPVP